MPQSRAEVCACIAVLALAAQLSPADEQHIAEYIAFRRAAHRLATLTADAALGRADRAALTERVTVSLEFARHDLDCDVPNVQRARALVGEALTECRRLLAAPAPSSPEAEGREEARIVALEKALADLLDATTDVTDRYIGGSALKGRLGFAIERLAQSSARAIAALASTPERTGDA
jgi:hypothetical protein